MSLAHTNIDPDEIRKLAARLCPPKAVEPPKVPPLNAIVQAVAAGHSTYAEIAAVTGLPASKVATYLARLKKAKLVRVVREGRSGNTGQPTIWGVL